MPYQKNEVKHILPPVNRHPGNSVNGQTSRSNQCVSLPPIQDNNKVTSRNNNRESPANTRNDYSKSELKQNDHRRDKNRKSRSRSRSADRHQRKSSRGTHRSRSNSRTKRKSNERSDRESPHSKSRSKEDNSKNSSRETRHGKKKSRSRSRDRKHNSRSRNHRSKSTERRTRSASIDRKQRSRSRERRKRSKSNDRKHRSKSGERRKRNKSYDRKHRSKSTEDRRSTSRNDRHRNKSNGKRRKSRESRNRREERHRSESSEEKHRRVSKQHSSRHHTRDESRGKERHRNRSVSRDRKGEPNTNENISRRYGYESRSRSRERINKERRKHKYRQSSLSSSDEEIEYKSNKANKHRRGKSTSDKLQERFYRKKDRLYLSEEEDSKRRTHHRRVKNEQYGDEYDSDDSEIRLLTQNTKRNRNQIRKQNKLKSIHAPNGKARYHNASNEKFNVVILENGEEYNSVSDEEELPNSKTIYIRSKSQHTGRVQKIPSRSKDYYSDVDTRNRVIDRQVIYYHDVEAEDNIVTKRDLVHVPRVMRNTNPVNAHPVVPTEPEELFYLVPASRKPNNNNSNQENLVYVNQSAERLVSINNPPNQNNGHRSYHRNQNDVVYGQEPMYGEYRQPVQQKFFNQHTNHYRHANRPQNIDTTITDEPKSNYTGTKVKVQTGINVQNSGNSEQTFNKTVHKLENMQINDFAEDKILNQLNISDKATSEERRSSPNDSRRSSLQSAATYVVNDSRLSSHTTPVSRVSTAEKRRALKHLGELSNYNIDIALGKTPLTAPPMTDENLLKKIFNDEFQEQMDEYLRS